jgi:hypothetical protein
MTILEDLKSGRLVVVPRDPDDAMIEVAYGVLTAELLSLVEGMERERDEALKAADEMDECQKSMFVKMKAAEAKADALREALKFLREHGSRDVKEICDQALAPTPSRSPEQPE